MYVCMIFCNCLHESHHPHHQYHRCRYFIRKCIVIWFQRSNVNSFYAALVVRMIGSRLYLLLYYLPEMLHLNTLCLRHFWRLGLGLCMKFFVSILSLLESYCLIFLDIWRIIISVKSCSASQLLRNWSSHVGCLDSDDFENFMSDVDRKSQVPCHTMYSDFSVKFMVFQCLGLSLETCCLGLDLAN